MISGRKRSIMTVTALLACWLWSCFAPPDGDVSQEPATAEPQLDAPSVSGSANPAHAPDVDTWVAAQTVSSTAGSELIRPEFADAGVCARCHVNIVLEWGISTHKEVGTACQECHGASDGHIENERNEVKPDRIPRGPQIATLCATCHEDGCPSTSKTADCQSCHHVHALSSPSIDRPAVLAEESARASR